MIKVSTLQKNQYVIETDLFYIFQSYDTIVAVVDKNNDQCLYVDRTKYSKTTSKWLNIFIQRYGHSVFQNVQPEELALLLDKGVFPDVKGSFWLCGVALGDKSPFSLTFDKRIASISKTDRKLVKNLLEDLKRWIKNLC